ncbi:phage tail assembly chaperone [bacterium]|jgi:hypothetical protein|nr:phage tail assembly chaperone [bacterium]
MAKTRITLTQKPTFPAPVAIPIPGEKPDVVVFTFKARTRKEFAEWMEALKEKNNVEAIMECVTGWALDDPFTLENVEQFNELYLGAAAAILDKYIAEITQAKLGN